ncbi:MAG: DeoR/GlpR transcriptional regulator [Phycisphaeraceae bacterium]|nr:DeoR/GlpR transcriptional regulator [Phycisphaeraceae bacterium]
MVVDSNISIDNSRPSVQRRLDEICGLLRGGQRISVADLSAKFGVSDVTIRRDLQLLEDAGRLLRTRGGAAAIPQAGEGQGGASNGSFVDRLQQARPEKEAIGRAAVAMLRPDDSVILDGGSTAFLAAHFLRDIPRLTVVTNSIPAILELVDAPGVEVLALGGVFNRQSMEFVGPAVATQLADLKARIAFLGADGLTLARGAQASGAGAVETARLLTAHAQEVVVLADASKLGRDSFGTYLPAEKIHTLITAGPLDERAEEEVVKLKACGVRIVRADQSPLIPNPT